MAFNTRQKYKIQKDGEVFNIKQVKLPTLIIVFQRNKKLNKITEQYLEDALKDGRVIELHAKATAKPSYKHPNWLHDYLIERDKIIADERNINKTP